MKTACFLCNLVDYTFTPVFVYINPRHSKIMGLLQMDTDRYLKGNTKFWYGVMNLVKMNIFNSN